MSHPSAVDPRQSTLAFRACLGQFATGVTVVTCRSIEGHRCGITANSFSSVSLDPPLILWNIAKESNSLKDFLAADCFAVHILTNKQESLSRHFARTDHTLFDNVEYEDSDVGVPLLPHCLAVFECSTHAIYEAGDHHIIVGHVDRFSWERDAPLLFYSGDYRELGMYPG